MWLCALQNRQIIVRGVAVGGAANDWNLLIVSLYTFKQNNLEKFHLIYLNLFAKFICKHDPESNRMRTHTADPVDIALKVPVRFIIDIV